MPTKVTIQDIADSLGLSRTTVSKVLNHSPAVSDVTRALVLDKANVATTPGSGFGPSGEGYVRLTAFGGAEATKEAVERIVKML